MYEAKTFTDTGNMRKKKKENITTDKKKIEGVNCKRIQNIKGKIRDEHTISEHHFPTVCS